jgi:mono/diheme cytochrome c family protein
MKEKGKRKEEKVEPESSSVRRTLRLGRALLTLLTFAFCLLPFALVSAHEPITTKVRFNKEVIRVLQRSCLGCHRPGGIAMSLATYEEARPWAKAIKEELLEKRMPPWHAVKGYGEFRNAPSLTQRDVDIIVNWVEGGAPKGDEKDLPAAPLFTNEWQLGKPDLTLKPDSESKVAADADEYRTFVLPTDVKEDRWLRAVDLQPGNASVVHCATIYILRDAPTATTPPMMPVKGDSTTQDLLYAWALATWMPGQKTLALDEGIGDSLPAGSKLAVKIHYRGSGEASTDLSTIGLYFAKAPVSKPIGALGVTGPESVIPVSDELRQFKMSFSLTRDRQAIAIRPLVHPLLTSFQATAYRPDGSEEVLIWTRGYKFDWRPTYYFKQPVQMPKGTRLEIIVYVDNSDTNPNNPNDPAKPVRWAELTSAASDPSTGHWAVFLFAEPVQ